MVAHSNSRLLRIVFTFGSFYPSTPCHYTAFTGCWNRGDIVTVATWENRCLFHLLLQ